MPQAETRRAGKVRTACWTVCATMLVAAATALAQSSTQDSSNSQPPAKSGQQSQPAPAHKSAAQENPFPANASKQQQGSQPAPANAPDAPDAANAPDAGQNGSSPTQKPGDAAKDNPFPEDVSKGAAAAASKSSDAGASTPAAAPYSSSSSSNPDGNAGADPNANPDVPPSSGRRRLRKPSDKDIQSGSLAGQGRATDDVRIGSYYLSTGNYQGAYGRFSEAIRLDPASVNAIYGLAASAEGLHHKDEALNNYKLYLAIAPEGNHAKSAAKALHSLAK